MRKADFEALRAALSTLRRRNDLQVDLEVAEFLVEAAGNLHHAATRGNTNYGPARDQLEKALQLLIARLPKGAASPTFIGEGDTEPVSED